ncbi:MAG: DnaJ C-terminal domain-containing protein [Pseudomonadota bacterium]
MQDFYKILGCNESDSKDEIKKKYRKLALKYHPDRNKDDKTAEAKFKEISEAYYVLSDEKKRAEYDQYKKMGFSGNYGQNFQGKYHQDFSSIFEDLFSGGGFSQKSSKANPFSDIFSDIFSGGFSQGQARSHGFGFNQAKPSNGSDVETNLFLPFWSAVNGSKQELKFNINRPCESCHGAGCAVCRNQGFVKKLESLLVTIPAGVDNGSKVRLQGKGAQGKNGGKNGDLYINIKVNPDKVYKRDGKDLKLDLPISLSEALNGTKVPIKLGEKEISLKIPARSKGNEQLRLKGKGVQSKTGPGDLYVYIWILLPEKINKGSEKLLLEFAEKNTYDPREGMF